MRLSLSDPLGFRQNGTPIWGFSGSDGEEDGGSGGTGGDGTGSGGGGDDADDTDDQPDAQGLTSKGRAALQQERTKAKNLTAEVRPLRQLLRDTGLTFDQLRALATSGGQGSQNGNGQQQGQGQGGDQVDPERIRQEARREAETAAQKKIALARVEARAARKFADPEDAVKFLSDETDDLLDRNGNPDIGAIDSALEDLLQRKPHLGKQEEGVPDFDGGSRNTAGGQPSMDGFLRGLSRTKREAGRR